MTLHHWAPCCLRKAGIDKWIKGDNLWHDRQVLAQWESNGQVIMYLCTTLESQYNSKMVKDLSATFGVLTNYDNTATFWFRFGFFPLWHISVCGLSCSRKNFKPLLSARYLLHASPYGQVWHKAFFRWVRTQGRCPHAPSISQKCLRPRRHSPN